MGGGCQRGFDGFDACRRGQTTFGQPDRQPDRQPLDNRPDNLIDNLIDNLWTTGLLDNLLDIQRLYGGLSGPSTRLPV